MAYFDSLQNEETLEYLGANISGGYPSFCKLSRREKEEAEKEAAIRFYGERIKSKDSCSVCNDLFEHECPACSKFIRSVLSDNIDFDLDDIFIDYYNKKLDLKAASVLINDKLEKNNSKLKAQIVLRDNVLDIESKNIYLILHL